MLYIGANHLGNVKDTPVRVIELLKNIDYVVIESEEGFVLYLKKLKIPVPNFLIYQETNEFLQSIMKLLKENKTILLLTDRGYPSIADPFGSIITLAIEMDILIKIIPGPSIGPVAIAASGFQSSGNILIETFDKEPNETINMISELKYLNYPIVVLCYKENILNIVKLAEQHIPNRMVVLCINLGMNYYEKILKRSYEDMTKYIENSTPEELFGPSNNQSVTTLVFGPIL